MRIANSESKQSWLACFRWLKQRGLRDVEIVVSDAHEGLVDALHQCFQGASWQRCQPHFRRNVIDKTPKRCHDQMHTGLDAIFEAEDTDQARDAFNELADELSAQADRALQTLEMGFEDAKVHIGTAGEVPEAAQDDEHGRAADRRSQTMREGV